MSGIAIRKLVILALAYAGAVVVGWAGSTWGVPLAWMLGPLFVAAILSMAGLDLAPSDNLRRLGQSVIGVGLGLQMTAHVLAGLAVWFPLMVLMALLSVAVSVVGAAALARFAHIDDTTAFYASLPGGLAEMGNVAARQGGRSDQIAVSHTVRVILVVFLVPPALLFLYPIDPADIQVTVPTVDLRWIPLLVLGGVGSALVLRWLKLNNPFLIGAVIFTAILTGGGVLDGRLPPALFAAAQVLIGFAVGCRCRRDIVRRLPRLILVTASLVVTMVVAMAGLGLVLAASTSIDLPSAILATAPGGMAEMAVTAQVLHLAVPLVVGFQLTRGVLVNALATHFHRIAVKSGYLSLLRRLI